MPQDKNTATLSPIAFSVYGFNQIDKESLLYFGCAIIKIYGTERSITEEEYQLFDTYFSEMLFIPRKISNKYRAFDPKSANFDTLLNRISIPVDANVRHMVLYDAIRWAKLSEHFLGIKTELNLERISNLLSVPLEVCLAIHGQVKTELSITELRKALFRVNYGKKPDKLPTPKNALKHSSWVTLNFGHTYTTYESLLHYCRMLVYLGAGDGDINEAEMNTVEAITLAAGTPKSIVSTLRDFDYKKTTLDSLLPKFVTDTYQDLDIISVYLTIRISRSSGSYGEPEMRKVDLAATALKVSESDKNLLENLVSLEMENEAMRRKLFEFGSTVSS